MSPYKWIGKKNAFCIFPCCLCGEDISANRFSSLAIIVCQFKQSPASKGKHEMACSLARDTNVMVILICYTSHTVQTISAKEQSQY